MRPTPGGLRNLEGRADLELAWPWESAEPLRAGVTAVLRVKDEARWLPWVLPPLLRACTEVLLVDNGSRDGSATMARSTAAGLGLNARLRVVDYPVQVARAGAEHLATPPTSVRSLAYFYNWCFAQVRTRWSWKWDGDMVLTPEGESTLRDLAWQVGEVPVVIRMPRHSVYVADDRLAWVDLGWRNVEEWGFPTGPDFVFAKAPEWEVRTTPPRVRECVLGPGMCVELKHLDDDEFDHWSDPSSFATSARSSRKRREWEVFHALRGRGQGDPAPLPVGVHEVHLETARRGSEVVDHVVGTWLPGRARPLLVEDPREDPGQRARRMARERAAADSFG